MKKKCFLTIDQIQAEIRKTEPVPENPVEKYKYYFDLLAPRLLDAAAKSGYPSCIPGPWCYYSCEVCHGYLTPEDWEYFNLALNLYKKIASSKEKKRYNVR